MPPTPKNVLMALADRADECGFGWPSISGMCEATCFSKRAVINALEWLERERFLRVSREDGMNNKTWIRLDRVAQGLQAVVAGVGYRRRREVEDALAWALQAIKGIPATSAPDAPVHEMHQCTTCTTTSAPDAPPPVHEMHRPVHEVHPNHQQPSGNRQETPPRPAAHESAPVKVASSSQPKSKRSTEDEPALFQEFWAAYPKKVARKDAVDAFRRQRVDRKLMDEMLRALECQRASEQWRRGDGKFIPYPATWLSGMRWTDEPPRIAGPTRGSGSATRAQPHDHLQEVMKLTGLSATHAQAPLTLQTTLVQEVSNAQR